MTGIWSILASCRTRAAHFCDVWYIPCIQFACSNDSFLICCSEGCKLNTVVLLEPKYFNKYSVHWICYQETPETVAKVADVWIMARFEYLKVKISVYWHLGRVRPRSRCRNYSSGFQRCADWQPTADGRSAAAVDSSSAVSGDAVINAVIQDGRAHATVQ